MTLAVEADPLLAVDGLRAIADVKFVHEAPGFLASVVMLPGFTPLARLSYALVGHLEEGSVLRQVMLTTASAHDPGVFLWLAGSSMLCLTP